MKPEEMQNLKPGDVIRHKGDSNGYIVTANYLSRVTAVRTTDVTNPAEWDLAPQPNKTAEQINWVSVSYRLPDDEITVLIFSPEFDEPCWPGYMAHGTWFQADGKPLGDDAVKYWAHMPGGPFSAPIIDD
jgi:hypothetical protein